LVFGEKAPRVTSPALAATSLELNCIAFFSVLSHQFGGETALISQAHRIAETKHMPAGLPAEYI